MSTLSTIPLTIKVPVADMKLLIALSRRTGLPRETLIQKFITSGAEDLGDVIVSNDSKDDCRLNGGKTYSQAEVDMALGLDD